MMLSILYLFLLLTAILLIVIRIGMITSFYETELVRIIYEHNRRESHRSDSVDILSWRLEEWYKSNQGIDFWKVALMFWKSRMSHFKDAKWLQPASDPRDNADPQRTIGSSSVYPHLLLNQDAGVAVNTITLTTTPTPTPEVRASILDDLVKDMKDTL